MHVYTKYWDILAWFIMFIDIVIIVLLVAFTTISNDIFIVVLITEMYGVFINHDYSPVVNMKCCYVLTIELDNNCFR